jgi:hypothetical protein
LGSGGRRQGAGRPKGTKKPGSKTAALLVRLTPEQRRALDALAEGTTLSAKVRLLLTEAINHGTQSEALRRSMGGDETFTLLQLVARAIETTTSVAATRLRTTWLDDPYLFDLALRAAMLVLDAARPDGEVVRPKGGPFGPGMPDFDDEGHVWVHAGGAIDEILDAPDEPPVQGAANSMGGEWHYTDAWMRRPIMKSRLKRLLPRLAKKRGRPVADIEKGKRKRK